MNSETRALIDEAREWPRDGIGEARLINDLADALEASAVSSHANCDYGEGWEEGFTAGKSSAVSSPSDEREHMQSLAKWVGVPESASSLEIACEVSSVLENLAVSSPPTITDDGFQGFVDGLGVDSNEEHDGDEWWAGYRQAQRDFIRKATAALHPGGETNG